MDGQVFERAEAPAQCVEFKIEEFQVHTSEA